MTTVREIEPTARNVNTLSIKHVSMGLHYNATGPLDKGQLDLKLSVVIRGSTHAVKVIGTYTDDSTKKVTPIKETIKLKPAQEYDLEKRIASAVQEWYTQVAPTKVLKDLLRVTSTA